MTTGFNAFRRMAAVLAVAITTASCGGDDATGTTANLSAAEVADLLDALISVTGGEGGSEITVGATPSLAAQTSTISVDDTGPCAEGGTVRLHGSATVDETTGAFTVDTRYAHTGCIAASSSGRLWTFNGNPDVRLQFSGSFVTGVMSVATQTGDFRYASEGKSGSCAIQTTWTFPSSTSQTIRVAGTVCGQSVDQATN